MKGGHQQRAPAGVGRPVDLVDELLLGRDDDARRPHATLVGEVPYAFASVAEDLVHVVVPCEEVVPSREVGDGALGTKPGETIVLDIERIVERVEVIDGF